MKQLCNIFATCQPRLAYIGNFVSSHWMAKEIAQSLITICGEMKSIYNYNYLLLHAPFIPFPLHMLDL